MRQIPTKFLPPQSTQLTTSDFYCFPRISLFLIMCMWCKSVHWSRAERLLVCRPQCPPAQCNPMPTNAKVYQFLAPNANCRKTIMLAKVYQDQFLRQKIKLLHPMSSCPNPPSNVNQCKGISSWHNVRNTTSSYGQK